MLGDLDFEYLSFFRLPKISILKLCSFATSLKSFSAFLAVMRWFQKDAANYSHAMVVNNIGGVYESHFKFRHLPFEDLHLEKKNYKVEDLGKYGREFGESEVTL